VQPTARPTAPRHAHSADAPPRRRWLAALGFDLQPRFAFAAGVATLAAGVLGYFIGTTAPDGGAPQGGVLIASADEFAALVRTLDRVPSGEKRALPTGAEVELMASFRTGSGALCREFRLARGGDHAVLAIACRGAQPWTVDFASTVAVTGGYAPASSATAAMDAYIASTGGGAPLSREDEARALAAR
jgi:hypothetical protein